MKKILIFLSFFIVIHIQAMSPAEKFFANIFSFVADAINGKKRKRVVLKALRQLALKHSSPTNLPPS